MMASPEIDVITSGGDDTLVYEQNSMVQSGI